MEMESLDGWYAGSADAWRRGTDDTSGTRITGGSAAGRSSAGDRLEWKCLCNEKRTQTGTSPDIGGDCRTGSECAGHLQRPLS